MTSLTFDGSVSTRLMLAVNEILIFEKIHFFDLRKVILLVDEVVVNNKDRVTVYCYNRTIHKSTFSSPKRKGSICTLGLVHFVVLLSVLLLIRIVRLVQSVQSH